MDNTAVNAPSASSSTSPQASTEGGVSSGVNVVQDLPNVMGSANAFVPPEPDQAGPQIPVTPKQPSFPFTGLGIAPERLQEVVKQMAQTSGPVLGEQPPEPARAQVPNQTNATLTTTERDELVALRKMKAKFDSTASLHEASLFQKDLEEGKKLLVSTLGDMCEKLSVEATQSSDPGVKEVFANLLMKRFLKESSKQHPEFFRKNGK